MRDVLRVRSVGNRAPRHSHHPMLVLPDQAAKGVVVTAPDLGDQVGILVTADWLGHKRHLLMGETSETAEIFPEPAVDQGGPWRTCAKRDSVPVRGLLRSRDHGRHQHVARHYPDPRSPRWWRILLQGTPPLARKRSTYRVTPMRYRWLLLRMNKELLATDIDPRVEPSIWLTASRRNSRPG
jgi:hypothetical protein